MIGKDGRKHFINISKKFKAWSKFLLRAILIGQQGNNLILQFSKFWVVDYFA